MTSRRDLTGIMVDEGNHAQPYMSLAQMSEELGPFIGRVE